MEQVERPLDVPGMPQPRADAAVRDRAVGEGWFLRRDPGEWYDVSASYPEKVRELEELAETARKDLGDNNTNSPGANRRPAGKLKK